MKYPNIEAIVKNLIIRQKTVATMESCTGGFVASEITNIEGASEVLRYSAVTYSNEYKIKMGVDPKIIDKYSVYSKETARDMSKKISEFAHSDYGLGVTGKLNRPDENNRHGADNLVYVSLYDKEHEKYYEGEMEVTKDTRVKNKRMVLDKVIELFNELE